MDANTSTPKTRLDASLEKKLSSLRQRALDFRRMAEGDRQSAIANDAIADEAEADAEEIEVLLRVRGVLTVESTSAAAATDGVSVHVRCERCSTGCGEKSLHDHWNAFKASQQAR